MRHGGPQTWPPPGSLATTSQACIHVHDLVIASGTLIIAGILAALAGISVAVARRVTRKGA